MVLLREAMTRLREASFLSLGLVEFLLSRGAARRFGWMILISCFAGSDSGRNPLPLLRLRLGPGSEWLWVVAANGAAIEVARSGAVAATEAERTSEEKKQKSSRVQDSPARVMTWCPSIRNVETFKTNRSVSGLSRVLHRVGYRGNGVVSWVVQLQVKFQSDSVVDGRNSMDLKGRLPGGALCYGRNSMIFTERIQGGALSV
ncbi:hypothetical protein LR48_Vigan04g190500 [Vigna angularis]|uniref:Uncharacterized protein n=1 Tax=Phaseolus angularis TaxID=3914 RepID=A0A0L9UGL8_PHAAN|nr:hypothetical protein LR48_Vigan04g190500 [Vigna angularis]